MKKSRSLPMQFFIWIAPIHILIVFDHPRRDGSFCGTVLDHLQQGLTSAVHTFEVASLRGDGMTHVAPVWFNTE